ncbi:MAG: nucleotidyltransferase family protein, partial [Candidatus Omnitrophota bacterium]
MMKKNTTNLLKKYAAFVLSGGNTGGKQAGVRESVPRMTKFLEDNELFYREGLAGRTVDYFCEISEAFKKKNLRFFSIKSFRSYDYADKDLDIVLVDKGRRNEYINTLEGLGFRFLWNRSVLREPYKRFYVKEGVKEGENLPKIHVHFAVSWNGMEFLDSEGVWKRLKSMNVSGREVMVPSPEDEILIMSAHSMYENGYVTVGELLHLKNVLSQSGSIDVERMLEESKRYNWRRGLKSFFALAEAYYGNLTGEELFPDRFGD